MSQQAKDAQPRSEVWLVEYLASSNGQWYPIHGQWYNFRKDAMKAVRSMNIQEDFPAGSIRKNRPAKYRRMTR
jgi:hypothetical protein